MPPHPYRPTPRPNRFFRKLEAWSLLERKKTEGNLKEVKHQPTGLGHAALATLILLGSWSFHGMQSHDDAKQAKRWFESHSLVAQTHDYGLASEKNAERRIHPFSQPYLTAAELARTSNSDLEGDRDQESAFISEISPLDWLNIKGRFLQQNEGFVSRTFLTVFKEQIMKEHIMQVRIDDRKEELEAKLASIQAGNFDAEERSKTEALQQAEDELKSFENGFQWYQQAVLGSTVVDAQANSDTTTLATNSSQTSDHLNSDRQTVADTSNTSDQESAQRVACPKHCQSFMQWMVDDIGDRQQQMMDEISDRQQRTREQSRLAQQIRLVENGVSYHTEMAAYFYSRGRSLARVAIFAGLFAGISGFLISQKGWQQSNNAVINVFITCSSLTLICSQIPNVFNYDENYEANQKLGLGYIELQNQIHSFIATEGMVGQNPEKPNEFSEMDTNRMIHYIDGKLSDLAQFNIAYDSAQVSQFSKFDPTSDIPTRMQ